MKTNKLSGAALDWAVAKCEDLKLTRYKDFYFFNNYRYSPSTDWAQGGPIIEGERICLTEQGGDYWHANWQAIRGGKKAFGETPLQAAMRCYVASKLGDNIDVPQELMQ